MGHTLVRLRRTQKTARTYAWGAGGRRHAPSRGAASPPATVPWAGPPPLPTRPSAHSRPAAASGPPGRHRLRRHRRCRDGCYLPPLSSPPPLPLPPRRAASLLALPRRAVPVRPPHHSGEPTGWAAAVRETSRHLTAGAGKPREVHVLHPQTPTGNCHRDSGGASIVASLRRGATPQTADQAPALGAVVVAGVVRVDGGQFPPSPARQPACLKDGGGGQDNGRAAHEGPPAVRI